MDIYCSYNTTTTDNLSFWKTDSLYGGDCKLYMNTATGQRYQVGLVRHAVEIAAHLVIVLRVSMNVISHFTYRFDKSLGKFGKE